VRRDSFKNERKPIESYDFTPIEKKIQSWVDSSYYPGASILVVQNDSIVYESYFGNYHKETSVFIASAGKWLAAATIASVVESTDLSWNDKVKKWLPEFNDIKGEATLRQLLSHTSGYPDYQPEGNPIDDYQSLNESVKHIVPLPADTIPGAAFHYGGLAMQVAGRMAELAAGKDFENLFQEMIAKPLEMNNTHFTPVNSKVGHNPMLGGGAQSTLRDYMNFLEMISTNGIFQGRRVLQVSTILEMQEDHVRGAKIVTPEYVEKVRAESHNSVYGLGEWREEINSEGNAVLLSSPSWAGAYPWIDKRTNTYGFFLAHVDEEKAKTAGFSSFYNSPVLPIMVRDVYKKENLPSSVETGFVDVGDAKLYYEETGEGEPIILIHGHSFDHTEWDPQFFEFAKDHRTIRYDCRGYGYSDLPVEGQEFLHANDLLQLMNSLNIEKAHLVGLSMGGFIATDFLALYPERLFSVTAASGDIFPVPGPSQSWTKESLAERYGAIEEIRRKGTMNQKWNWFSNLMQNTGNKPERIKRKVWDMIYKWDQWQPLHAEPHSVLGNDVVPLLQKKKINVSVLVLKGEVDRDKKNKLLELLPSAVQKVVPDAGHVSNLENTRAFNEIVLNFIMDSSN